MSTPKTPPVRLQFDASASTVASLDEATHLFGTPTRAETIRKALNVLFRIANVMAEDGGEFTVFRKDGTKEKWIL